MVKVSFIGYNNYKTSIPIAAACGIGNFAYSKYKSNKIFDELKLIAKKKFRVVSPENADILIYPHKLELKDKLSNIQNFASEKKIPFLLFRDDDNKKSANIKYGTVCRSSIFKKKSKKNEVAMPALVVDLLKDNNCLFNERNKRKIPLVSFCGYCGDGISEFVYLLQGRKQKFDGLNLRYNVLKSLEESPIIKTNFIKRKNFRAGVTKDGNTHLINKVKKEFFDNIINSDYSLATRGKGNFSHRLYEILCCGRIPLFVNTDCVLPFENQINWKEHCIWVEYKDIKYFDKIINEFHNSIDSNSFIRMQQSNRILWKEWLSPEGFYLKIINNIINKFKYNFI